MQLELKGIRTKLELYKAYLNRKIVRIQGAQAPGNREDLQQLTAEYLQCQWLISELHSRENKLDAQLGQAAPVPLFFFYMNNAVLALIGIAICLLMAMLGWNCKFMILVLASFGLVDTVSALMTQRGSQLHPWYFKRACVAVLLFPSIFLATMVAM